MARKKKTVDTSVDTTPVEEVAQNEPTVACTDDSTGEVVTIKGDESMTQTEVVHISSEEVAKMFGKSDNALLNSYTKEREYAISVIEKCNLRIWASLDWSMGRVYEMARTEWAKYVIDLDCWKGDGFKGTIPPVPQEPVFD